MNYIQNYSFHDGKILSIHLSDRCVEILFEKWDCKQIKLSFEDYRKITDNQSVGKDVGDLLINKSPGILDEVKAYIFADGGSEEESIGLNVYSFENSCGDNMLLEIVALNLQITEIHEIYTNESSETTECEDQGFSGHL